MSFGFSVGDFISLSQLALTVYTSLQRSQADFQSITGEVNALTVILKAIASRLAHVDQDDELIKELKLFHRRTRTALEKVQVLLQKHQGLKRDKPRPLDRVRWVLSRPAAADNLRTELQIQVGVLSCLNSNLIKLSQDRLEQNISMLVQHVTQGTPLNNKLLAHRPAPPSTCAATTDYPFPDPQPGAETPVPGHNDRAYRDAAADDGTPKSAQYWRCPTPPASSTLYEECSITTIGDQGQPSLSSSEYRHMRAGGNSFQVNGDIGISEARPSRNTTYFGVVSEGNSIQFNGHILDAAFLGEATKR